MDMPEPSVVQIVIAVLSLGQIAVLTSILKIAITIAQNQKATNDKTTEAAAVVAAELKGADRKRETADEDGGSAVKTKSL